MIRGADAEVLADLLADLAHQHVRLQVVGDRLRCNAPPGILTEDLLARVRARKAEILRYLAGPDDIPATGTAHSETVPLSYAQEQLWLAQHLDPDSCAYNLPTAARLTGPVHPHTLRAALAEVVHRHEALRTSFPVRQGQPQQHVAAFTPPALPLVDLSGLPDAAAGQALISSAADVARRPFNLAAAPPIRTVLVRRDRSNQWLLMTRHHIVSDGWSFGVHAAELSASYTAFRDGRPAALPSLPRQYAHFARWQRRAGADQEIRQHLDTWRRRLDGAMPGLAMLDGARSVAPAAAPVPAARIARDLSQPAARPLHQLARDLGTTAFTVLATAFGLALASAAGQREVVVGAATSGRVRADLTPLIGCFATVLPLRLHLGDAATFREAVELTRAVVGEALAIQDVPVERITRELRLPRRGDGRSPLYDAVFAFQNTAAVLDLPDTVVELADPEPVAPKFPLTLTMTAQDGGYRLLAEYDASMFSGAFITAVLDRFLAVLDLGCRTPERPPAELAGRAARPPASPSRTTRGTTLGAAFAATARRTPDAIAVSHNGAQLTYAALLRQAKRLARALRAAGVSAEIPVGLCVEHCADLAVAVVGIVLAGGTYVPVDIDDPPARREAVLADAGARALVTQARRGGEFTWFEGPIVHVDRLSPHDNHSHQAAQALTGDHVAYVIYTSGSTGAPKGVMVRHGSIASLITAAGQVFPFGPGDVWTLAHASAFDFSVWELWGPLLSGGRVIPVPRETARDPRRLWRLMCTEQVTMLSATPSALHQLDPADVDFRDSALRAVVLGGERCDPRLLAGWLGDNRPAMLNMYGITETTVHVTSRRLTAADVTAGGSPIGSALPGQRMHVVDVHGVPVAAGGRGELLVGGTGVARGYLGRPGLTADRFRPDHLGGEPGARLYRSGDLGRLLPDGAVDYLGRLDDQLKVRGYRIEPAEIETALAGHPDVGAAAVGASAVGASVAGDQRQVLTAYVVPATPTTGIRLSSRDLRRFLAERLPPHLVPASYVVLGRLPLTRNGKLDRAALAAMPVAAGAVAESDRPHTATEGTLAELWRDLLSLPAVGIHDDFFDIGGDSLAVTRLHARLPALFGVELPMRRLYHALTIEAQATVIDDLLATGSPGLAS